MCGEAQCRPSFSHGLVAHSFCCAELLAEAQEIVGDRPLHVVAEYNPDAAYRVWCHRFPKRFTDNRVCDAVHAACEMHGILACCHMTCVNPAPCLPVFPPRSRGSPAGVASGYCLIQGAQWWHSGADPDEKLSIFQKNALLLRTWKPQYPAKYADKVWPLHPPLSCRFFCSAPANASWHLERSGWQGLQ